MGEINEKKGGAAFPGHWIHADGSVLNQWTGMSLRDYAAVHFMAALISTQEGMSTISRVARESKVDAKLCAASAAIEFADAFLTVRGKP